MSRLVFIVALMATGIANANVSFQDFVGSYNLINCKQYDGDMHSEAIGECVAVVSKVGIESASSEGIQLSFQDEQGITKVVSLFEYTIDVKNGIEQTTFVEEKNKATWLRTIKNPTTIETTVIESYSITSLSDGHPVLVHQYVGTNSLHVRQVYRLDSVQH